MKNKFELKSRLGAHEVAIIGLKGLPPDFVGTSGVEFYVAQKIPTLLSRGFSVRCYVRAWATPKGITHYLGAKLVQTPSVPVGFLDAITHSFASTVHACFSSADIVWYHATGSLLFSFLPIFFGKKVYVTIHTLEWKRVKWGWFAKFVLKTAERIGVRCSVECFAVSKSLGRYIEVSYNKNVHVDEPKMMTHDQASTALLKNKYNLFGRDYVLYLGRFVPEKRVEWLIRAYKRLHPTNMKLVIAGGETYGRLYETSLRRSAEGSKDILFVGWVFGDIKQALLDNCALFVLPSSVEGNPIVLHELPTHTSVLVSDIIGKEIHRKKNMHIYKHDNEADFFLQLRNAINRIK